MGAHRENYVPFLQELFRENPYLSVNQAAKECDKHHMPIQKDLITAVRRKVRSAAGLDVPALEIVHSVPEQREELVVPKPPLPPPPKPEAKEETSEERLARKRRFVDDLILENPSQTTRQITEEVKKAFNGQGVDVRYLVTSLNAARELVGKPPVAPGRPKQEKPAVSQSAAPVVAVKPALKPQERPMPAPASPLPAIAQMRVICWQDDKQEVQFEMVALEDVKDRVMRLLGRGVKETSIEVWKKTSFKIKLDIDID